MILLKVLHQYFYGKGLPALRTFFLFLLACFKWFRTRVKLEVIKVFGGVGYEVINIRKHCVAYLTHFHLLLTCSTRAWLGSLAVTC